MSIQVQGTIVTLQARIDASGDTVQKVVLEFHGDFPRLYDLMKKPIWIIFTEDGNEEENQ